MLILGFTTLLFPIVGSALVQHFGFRLALDLVSIALLLNSSIYVGFTIKDWISERKEAEQRRQEEDQSLLIPRENNI